MSIDGTYNVRASTPVGVQEGKIVLKTEGESLSGSVTTRWGTENFTGGKVSGNQFEFTYSGKSPFGRAKFKYTGTVEGDRIWGECAVRPRAVPLPIKSRFEGTREK